MTFIIWALTLDSDRVSPLVAAVIPVDYFGRVIASISLLWTFVISGIPSTTVSSVASPPPAPAA